MRRIKFIYLVLVGVIFSNKNIYSQQSFYWPLSNSSTQNADLITSPFGPRQNNGPQIHYGMDLQDIDSQDNYIGKTVHASYTGKVVAVFESNNLSDGTIMVFEIINSNVKEYLIYMHSNDEPSDIFSACNCSVGQTISFAQPLYTMGDGNGQLPLHLHLSYVPKSYSQPGTNVFNEYRKYASNPVGLFDNVEQNYQLENVRVEDTGNGAKFKFDLKVDPKQIDFNRIEVYFNAYTVELGKIARAHTSNNGYGAVLNMISSSPQIPVYNINTTVTQKLGVIDLDKRIGYDYGDRDINNDNSEWFNGVFISAESYSSSLQTNDHKYSIEFFLNYSVLEDLVGGFNNIEIRVFNSDNDLDAFDSFLFPSDINDVAWTERWNFPDRIRQNLNVTEINIIDGGKIIVETNDPIAGIMTLPWTLGMGEHQTIRVKEGGVFEMLPYNPTYDFRNRFYVSGDLIIESGGKLKLGENALLWILSDVYGQNGEYSFSRKGYLEIQSGAIQENNGGEIWNHGKAKVIAKLELNTPAACILVKENGELILENGADLYAGGIIIADTNSTVEVNGILELDDSISGDGYALDIKEGATFKMGYNSKILVNNGAKIRSQGTLTNPVKFTYYEPTWDEANAWSGIEMRGDSNVFKHTIVEGTVGSALYFRSKNNVVEYSNIRDNPDYGIRVAADYSGGYGSVKISDSKIENNGHYGTSKHGIYITDARVGLEYNDIKNNGGDGIYLSSSVLGNPNDIGSGYFRGNDIFDNTSNAIQLGYAATVYDGYSTTKGYNNIDRNASHEVYLSSTSSRWWDASGGSYTAVLENTSSTATKYVYNLAQTTSGESTISWTVGMENNAWDYATPSSGKFYGSVDYTPYKTTQLFGSAGPRGSVAAKMIATNSSSFGNQVISNNTISNVTEGLNSDEERDYHLQVRNELSNLISEIENKPTDSSIPQKLNGVLGYYNELSEAGKSDFAVVKSLIASYKSNGHLLGISKGVSQKERLASETSLMLEAHQLLMEGNSELALESIEEHKGRFSNLDIQREIGLVKANAQQELEMYEEAMRTYNELSILSSRGVDPSNTQNDYADEIAYLQELIHERDGTKPEDIQGDIKVKPVVDSKPTEFKLNAAYPNPFNPSTVFSFEMPEAGVVKVDVYDISGRLVSVLTNQNYQVGVHSLTFDASELASGMYLIRADIAGTIQSQKITLIK